MVIERVDMMIKAGMRAEFSAVMQKRREVILAAVGCRAVDMGWGVESPGKFLLMVRWRAVADHIAFTRSPTYAEFAAPLGGFIDTTPAVEHFTLI